MIKRMASARPSSRYRTIAGGERMEEVVVTSRADRECMCVCASMRGNALCPELQHVNHQRMIRSLYMTDLFIQFGTLNRSRRAYKLQIC